MFKCGFSTFFILCRFFIIIDYFHCYSDLFKKNPLLSTSWRKRIRCHFKEFRGLVENQTRNRIKILRTDNGGEFCSSEMESYLKQTGILHQKINPNTAEQNGLSERFNRTVVERARCLLFEADLDKSFWV